jgi:hypothetical protein
VTRYADHTFTTADILGTSVVNGEIRAKLGFWQGTEDESPGISQQSPVWSTFGFDSRPADPDINGACMASCTTDGDEVRVSGSRDLRMSGKLPDIAPGDSRAYGYAGNFTRWYADGEIASLTTDDGTPQGRSISERLSPEDGWVVSTPWGSISIGPYGINLVHASGAKVMLGSIAGIPSPGGVLDSLSGYVRISAPLVHVKGGAIGLGTDGGVGNEVAVNELATILSQLIQAISLITSATSGAAALSSALLPASGAVALPILQPLLSPIGKVV